MSYISRFSVLRSADQDAPATPPVSSQLQTDYAKAALATGMPSTQVAQLLTTFVTSNDFMASASAGIPQSAKALADNFNQPGADKAAVLKQMQALAADPQAAATEQRLSDSLLAMYWLPKQASWDTQGVMLARKALAAGRLTVAAGEGAVQQAATIFAQPLAPATVRLPLRPRPAPPPARDGGGKPDPTLQNLLDQRSEVLALASALRNARPTDVKLSSQIGRPIVAKAMSKRVAAAKPSFAAASVLLPLSDAMKAQIFALAPNAMKTLGYAEADDIGLSDLTTKVQGLQSSIATQLNAQATALPWFIPQMSGGGTATTSPNFTSSAPPQTYLPNVNLIRIQDFYYIEQVWTGYARDEISYIENVMAGETYARLFDNTTTTVDSETDSTETVTEQQQDLSTNTRDDLQRETTQAVSSQASVSAGFQIGYSGGGVTIATDLNASYSNSQQSSTTAAQDFTTQVASEAMQSLKKTVSQQTFHQVTTVTQDKANHRFKNATEEPIIGIYQYVNKLYELQTYLYDAKLVIDVTVPEPAALLLEQLGASGSPTTAAAQVPDFNIAPSDIQPDTYLGFGQLWGVSNLPVAPANRVTLSKTFSYESGATDKLDSEVVAGSGQGQDLPLPDGYYAQQFRIQVSVVARDNKRDFSVSAFAGTVTVRAGGAAGSESDSNYGFDTPSTWEQGSVGIGVTAVNASAYSVVFEIDCGPSGDGFLKWQTDIFEALQAGYQKMLDDAANQARLNNILGPSNLQAPGVAQDVVLRELKRCVISLISQQSFDWAGAIDEGPGAPGERLPDIDFALAQQQADYIQFFELAFEWPLLQYVTYPYFWGRKDQWGTLLKLSNDDPNFLDFLTAGACRVVVPIRDQWSNWVEQFLEKGTWPSQSDLLNSDGTTSTPGAGYVTISDQITALKSAIPVGGTLLPQVTPVVVPTNMVILSTSTDLPQPAAANQQAQPPAQNA